MGCGVSKTVSSQVVEFLKPEHVATHEHLLGSSVEPQDHVSETNSRKCSGLFLLKKQSRPRRMDGRPPRRNTVHHFGLKNLSNAAPTADSLVQQTKSSEVEQLADIRIKACCNISSLRKNLRRDSSCASFCKDKIRMDQNIEVAIVNPQLRAERVSQGFRINGSSRQKSRKNSLTSNDLEVAAQSKPPTSAIEPIRPPQAEAPAEHKGRECPGGAPGLSSLKLIEKTSTERTIISTKPYRRYNFLQNEYRLPGISPTLSGVKDPIGSPQKAEETTMGFPVGREHPLSRASAFKRVEREATSLVEAQESIPRSTAGQALSQHLELFSQSSKVLDSAEKEELSKATPTSIANDTCNKPNESFFEVGAKLAGLPIAKELRIDRLSYRSGAHRVQNTPDESLLPKGPESRGSRHFSDTRNTRASQSSAQNEQQPNERFAEVFKNRRHEIRKGNSRQKEGSVSSLSRFSSKTPDIPRFQSPTIQQSMESSGLFQAKRQEQSYIVHVTTSSVRPAARQNY